MRILRVAKEAENEGLRALHGTYIKDILGLLAKSFRVIDDKEVKNLVKRMLKVMRHVNKALQKEDERLSKGAVVNPEFSYELYHKVAVHYNGSLFRGGIRKGLEEIYPALGELKLPEIHKKAWLSGEYKEEFEAGMGEFVTALQKIIVEDFPVIREVIEAIRMERSVDKNILRSKITSQLSSPARMRLAIAIGIIGIVGLSTLAANVAFPSTQLIGLSQATGDALMDVMAAA